MVTAEKPPPIHVLSRLMGHSSTEITEIYLQVVGDEQRNLVMEVGWLKTRKIRKQAVYYISIDIWREMAL